ncbi:MAG: hypothetical protein EAZ37_16180 [Burkholderiales bacterium]|nr:MAG: hypothetical protein EAZ43_15405 [Betaproteobacteria bacterium]TAG24458.1 MAG: hypothetical protein EAZ37_16180 [Burkholderiales bacterium]
MALQFIRESANDFTITGFEPGAVRVGTATFDAPISLSHNHAAAAWPVNQPLDAASIAAGAALDAEIVIIGTGARLVFPAPAALQPLRDARIGFEVMDSRAACRTYNVLLAEGRKAGLLLIVGD